MNVFKQEEAFSLPDELAQLYEVRSCLKYTEQSATYLLREKTSGRFFLLKTAEDPVFADLLANEKTILECIHQSDDGRMEGSFPVPVYLASHTGISHFPAETADTHPKSAAKERSTHSTTYYIRTYIEGKTLEELCESNYRKPGLDDMRALDYVIELTELLCFLHNLEPPVIHRDIKPQNVVIDTEGGCHFIDLGISRFYQSAKRSDTVIMGTKLTAPPEQFGYQQTDVRSDLYSLGVLLYYCLTGEYEIDEQELEGLDPRVQCIIRKATMFDPNKRYQKAEELLPALLSVRYSWKDWSRLLKLRKELSVYQVIAGISVLLNLILILLLFN